MRDFEEKLAAAAFSQLTPEQREKVAQSARSFAEELDRDPALLKEAIKLPMQSMDWGALRNKALGALALGGGAAAGVKAVNFLANKAQEYGQSMGKAKAYKDMLDANPQLSDADVDAKAVQRHFDTLFRFNPEYASDPLVSGAYVQNAVEMARPSLDAVNNIVNARRNMMDSRHKANAGDAAVQKLVGLLGSKGIFDSSGGGGQGGEE